MTNGTQTALVTGGAKRIGRAISMALAKAGYNVAVHYRDSAADAEALAATIAASGGRAAALDADLADEEETAALIGRATEALGPVTALVNNASLFERDEAMTATRESWDTHLAVNLRAPFVLIQAMARAMPSQARGAVVNIIDQRVWNPTPHFTSYTLSKAGLWTLTQSQCRRARPGVTQRTAIGDRFPAPSRGTAPRPRWRTGADR
jgi:NAD(P)-dependent dehydrogenase (short-subunit alcohol dehydrogenase family)